MFTEFGSKPDSDVNCRRLSESRTSYFAVGDFHLAIPDLWMTSARRAHQCTYRALKGSKPSLETGSWLGPVHTTEMVSPGASFFEFKE